jgi:hypothetical protein
MIAGASQPGGTGLGQASAACCTLSRDATRPAPGDCHCLRLDRAASRELNVAACCEGPESLHRQGRVPADRRVRSRPPWPPPRTRQPESQRWSHSHPVDAEPVHDSGRAGSRSFGGGGGRSFGGGGPASPRISARSWLASELASFQASNARSRRSGVTSWTRRSSISNPSKRRISKIAACSCSAKSDPVAVDHQPASVERFSLTTDTRWSSLASLAKASPIASCSLDCCTGAM